ncbi:MAG: hypothetical protein ACI3Y4_08385 [Candidatus Cryptobacteroides sp.]
MKLKNTILAAAVLLLGSCTESAISPLEGIYDKPADFVTDELVSSSIEKLNGVRCFDIVLADAEGKLEVKFYGDKYYLESQTYNAADAASVKNGFYLVGEGGSTYTAGGKSVAIDHGGISVFADGSDYAFSGTVWLADGSSVKINAKVTLVYEPDPEPVILSTVLSASSNVANGTPTVSLSLAQEGISSVQNPDWTTTWYGEGYYLALDLYSADGYLHEGTYSACAAGGQVTEGTFGIGWDPGDIFGWGIEFTDWGTCWWSVSGGAAKSEKKITEGTVTVERDGNKWIIDLQSGEGKDMIWGRFEGEIPALADPSSQGEVKYKELTKVLSANTQNAGMLTLQFATEDVTSTFNPENWQTTYSGTGFYLALDIYSADQTLAPGTYKACAEGGKIGEGEFGIGYDTEMWGMQFYNWGTCWWTVTDGATSAEKVLDGTVEVSLEGDTYTVALQSSTVNARYIGPVTL